MATRLLASVALVGATSYAWGAALPGQDSCGHPDGSACRAGDHSLLQVVSHPSAHTKAMARGGRVHKRKATSGRSASNKAGKEVVELLDSGATSKMRSKGPELGQNRTIENITRAISAELKDLEDFANLLALGRHKLCAADAKNADRVATLMALLKVQSLLQVGVAESPQQKGEGLEQAGKTHDGDDKWLKDWFSDDKPAAPPSPHPTVEEDAKKLLEAWWKSPKPKEADPISKTTTDLKDKKEVVDNRTLTNITADVGTEVGDVEKIMSDIQAEGDRLEVVSVETADRSRILLSTLAEESQQCESGGEYTYGGMLQTDKQSHSPEQNTKATLQSTLQTSREKARKRFTKEEIQKYLKPSAAANQSITYWTLTETIKNITTQLETDVNALIREKNMLSVAGAEGVSHLDNLEDTMKGQGGGSPASEVKLAPAALQIGQAVNSHTPPVPGAEPDDASDTLEEHPALVNVSATVPAGNATGTAQSNATLTAELQAAEIAKLQGEISRKEMVHSSAQVAQQQVAASSAAATASEPTVPEIGDLLITDLTFGVDKQVVNLEADVSILGEQKHEVCWVTKDTMDKLQTIVSILKMVPC